MAGLKETSAIMNFLQKISHPLNFRKNQNFQKILVIYKAFAPRKYNPL